MVLYINKTGKYVRISNNGWNTRHKPNKKP